VLKSHIND